MELVKKVDDDALLPFVGYCRAFVVDSDGLQRKTKGSRVEAPIHMRTEGTKKIFSAYFPAKDPVVMLKLQAEQQEFVYAKIWVGTICKPDENPNNNRLLCVVEGQNCKKLSEEVDGSPDNCCKCKAYMPFLVDCYSKPLDARMTTVDEKFVTKLVKVEVEIPDELYAEWLKYYQTLKRVEKEDDEDKKSDKK